MCGRSWRHQAVQCCGLCSNPEPQSSCGMQNASAAVQVASSTAPSERVSHISSHMLCAFSKAGAGHTPRRRGGAIIHCSMPVSCCEQGRRRHAHPGVRLRTTARAAARVARRSLAGLAGMGARRRPCCTFSIASTTIASSISLWLRRTCRSRGLGDQALTEQLPPRGKYHHHDCQVDLPLNCGASAPSSRGDIVVVLGQAARHSWCCSVLVAPR